jgi:pyruvate/2-oxoglutarate/acetoin dehydrogenase E1 component
MSFTIATAASGRTRAPAAASTSRKSYFDELVRAMTWLGQQPRTLFLGQAVAYPGTAMFNTLRDVPAERRREFPVAEDFQMGASIGLALAAYVPISIFPRWNFLLLAVNQLVNHLDKLPLISDYRPKVIIRTGVGSVRPLDPQWQHKGDFTDAIQMMLKTIRVVRLEEPEDIVPSYQEAYESDESTILCEVSDFLNEK